MALRMPNGAPALVLATVITACTPARPATTGDVHGPDGRTGTGVLHIQAIHHPAYCGGVDPGLDLPRSHPWQGTLYLRPARPDSSGRSALNDLGVPIVDSVRTDGQGQGDLRLPAGHYLLLDRDRTDDRRYHQLLREHHRPTLHTQPIDTACMRQWLHGPFGTVTIRPGDTTRVDLPFRGQCPWNDTPCVVYFGPYPP